MCTQALSVKDYYDHSDFKSNYTGMLGEDYLDCMQQITTIIRANPEEFGFSGYPTITDEQAETILDWFVENGEVRTFENNYVGYYCIDSVSFGEQYNEIQEEEGKTLEELQAEFEEECFYVNGLVAYYDLSGSGLYWDLRDMPIEEFMRVFQ